MSKPGIKIVEESIGDGHVITNEDRVVVRYDLHLNKGECISRDETAVVDMSDRETIAGLRYGLEGMKIGGTRKFKAGPHLCYREAGVTNIPKNAVLIFTIKDVQKVPRN